MSEYLVRWKFGPNSLVNHLDRDTQWFQQIHQTREVGVSHYISLLQSSSPSMAMTVQIFELVQLIPGEEKSKIMPRGPYASKKQREYRLERIKEMHEAGCSKSEIAATFGITSEYVRQIMHKNNIIETKE